MTIQERIEDFLSEGPFAVVGASTNREKYGNKVLRAYLQNHKEPLYAVHPSEESVEGVAAYPDLASLPEVPRAISIITPPAVTERVVAQAIEIGVRHIWMQPGAESEEAVRLAEEAGIDVIAGGPCALVALHYRE
ncbi:MAG TPA: CoA-binding protein [Planctomycetes bacterium]|nr:CoA-binding protein [Planctomycetota bacterium]